MFQHRGKREQYAVYAACGLFFLAAGYVGAGRLRQPEPVSIQSVSTPTGGEASPSSVDQKTIEPLSTEVVVDVTGAVRRPGVQRLPVGARVDAAVHAAGGAKPNADLDQINLAAKLVDGSVVYVPPKQAKKPDALTPPSKVATIYRGGAASRPIYAPPLGGQIEVKPLSVDPPTASGPTSASAPAETQGAAETHMPRGPKQPSGPVSLNTATSEELQTLPGIGPATAQKILDYRSEHGPFSSVDQILEVKGIGPKKLEKLREWLRL